MAGTSDVSPDLIRQEADKVGKLGKGGVKASPDPPAGGSGRPKRGTVPKFGYEAVFYQLK